jgi:hypothetical protein
VVTEHGLWVLVVDGDDFLESLAPEIVQRVAIDAVGDVTRLEVRRALSVRLPPLTPPRPAHPGSTPSITATKSGMIDLEFPATNWTSTSVFLK